MLKNIDLSRKVEKAEYKKVKGDLDLKLAELQRRAKELGLPVLILFEGWDAAGKGTLINELILPLDPRGFNVTSTLPPNQEEALRPFLWRFWSRTPARGRIAVYDRSWYRRVLADRVDGLISGSALQQSYQDILSFERQLADDGNIIIKFFLHISKDEQKRRFKKLRENPVTAWRISEGDLKRHKQYSEYLAVTDDMLARTDTEFGPWTIVEAHDQRFATLKIFNVVIAALEQRIKTVEARAKPVRKPAVATDLPSVLRASVLDKLDLNQTLTQDEYRDKLKKAQAKLRELEHEIYTRRIPVVIMYEGCDAAGKGGNIRRVTQHLDPRGYEVIPTAAPNDVEKAHHYLWRFWIAMPKAGHITIFDRSWYGRVLVERVEGFCAENEWKRAYHEINEMEQHLTNYGTVLLKFWLQIDPDEQLRRFREREATSYKQWKITAEDWRNREKWDVYKQAIDEMLFRTSTPCAPWTVVESNCKWFARVKILNTIIRAIEKRLKKK